MPDHDADTHDDDIAFVYAYQQRFLDTYDRTDPRSDFHTKYCSDPYPCRHAKPHCFQCDPDSYVLSDTDTTAGQ